MQHQPRLASTLRLPELAEDLVRQSRPSGLREAGLGLREAAVKAPATPTPNHHMSSQGSHNHVDLWVPVAGASVKLASLPADAPSWSIDQVR